MGEQLKIRVSMRVGGGDGVCFWLSFSSRGSLLIELVMRARILCLGVARRTLFYLRIKEEFYPLLGFS